MRLMNLEPIIQSEVGQKENNKYRNQTRIYMESRKMLLKNLFTGQQWRNKENRLMDMGERGGEGETCGKSNMETYVTICKIDRQQ